MDRRALGNAALLAGAAALLGTVALIWIRRPQPVTGEMTEALHTFRELQRELLAGRDSASLRRRLVDQLRDVKPSDTRLALGLFADGQYEAAAAAVTTSELPFDQALRGCSFLQLGRKQEAAGMLRKALESAPAHWPMAELFRETLAKASS